MEKIAMLQLKKKIINIKLPFADPQTCTAKRKLSALITKFYPHEKISTFIKCSDILHQLFNP